MMNEAFGEAAGASPCAAENVITFKHHSNISHSRFGKDDALLRFLVHHTRILSSLPGRLQSSDVVAKFAR